MDQLVNPESRALLESGERVVLQEVRVKKDIQDLQGPLETKVTLERMAPRQVAAGVQAVLTILFKPKA